MVVEETIGVEEAEGNAIVGEVLLVFVFDVELDGLLEVLFGLVKEIEGGRAIGYYGVADNVSFWTGSVMERLPISPVTI